MMVMVKETPLMDDEMKVCCSEFTDCFVTLFRFLSLFALLVL